MAVAFKIRILDLIPEFPAHALRILGLFQAARAIAALLLKPFLNDPDDLGVGIERDLHKRLLWYPCFRFAFLSFRYYITKPAK